MPLRPTLQILAGFTVLALTLSPPCAIAKDRMAGPLAAEVVRAIDGDTLEVKVQIWLGQELTTNVRVRGIDAPEMKGRCQKEKEMAQGGGGTACRTGGRHGELSNVEADKYGGRVLADVETVGGAGLARLMLASGLVRAYDGGARGPAWSRRSLAETEEIV